MKIDSPNNLSPKFSLITVNYNNADLLIEVLDRTLITLKGLEFEAIVVNNGSTDDSMQKLESRYSGDSKVRVIDSERNGGFGYGCNLGARCARSPILWFLNSDAWVSSSSGLDSALALAERPGTGMVGTSVLLDNMTPSPQGGSNMSFGYLLVSSFRPGAAFRALPQPLRQILQRFLRHLPGIFGQYAKSFHHHSVSKAYESRGVGGASFLIRASVFNRLNGFDEGFFLYDEDADLCLRCIELKLVNLIEPKVRVLTYPSATTSKLPSLKLKQIKRDSRFRLISKHFSGMQRHMLRTVTVLTWRLL